MRTASPLDIEIKGCEAAQNLPPKSCDQARLGTQRGAFLGERSGSDAPQALRPATPKAWMFFPLLPEEHTESICLTQLLMIICPCLAAVDQ